MRPGWKKEEEEGGGGRRRRVAQCHPLPPVASMLLSPTVAPGPLIDLAGDVIAWATKGVEEAKEVEGAEEDKESLRVGRRGTGGERGGGGGGGGGGGWRRMIAPVVSTGGAEWLVSIAACAHEASANRRPFARSHAASNRPPTRLVCVALPPNCPLLPPRVGLNPNSTTTTTQPHSNKTS